MCKCSEMSNLYNNYLITIMINQYCSKINQVAEFSYTGSASLQVKVIDFGRTKCDWVMSL